MGCMIDATRPSLVLSKKLEGPINWSDKIATGLQAQLNIL